MQNLKFSCVVDNKPLFKAQAFVWMSCLFELLGVEAKNIFVHQIGDYQDEFTNWVDNLGVKRIYLPPFDSRNHYCNKILQLETFRKFPGEEYVVLTDCDIAILSLSDLHLHAPIHAKIVDFAVPPFDIIEQLFIKADLGPPVRAEANFMSSNGTLTDFANCNGGVYFIKGCIITQLIDQWVGYANWCLKYLYLFREYANHVDQISFAMAVRKLGIEISHLDLIWNFPAHVNPDELPDVKPKILHYHQMLDENFHLKQVGLKKVDKTIQDANSLIKTSLKKNFLNTIFWNARYERFPVLGSGIGSRGEALERKKQLISKCIYGSVNLTIVDVGCGDLEAMKDFNFKNYLGIDISEKAIEIAKTKRSEWKFVVGDIRLLSSYEADVVLCLDVLIHQKTRKDFEDILQALINMCKKRLIVGSYNCLPNYTSDITFFHRPILEALEESHLFSEISVVGKYRDCSLVVADKHTNSIKDPHLRDLKAKDFNQASKLCTRPDLLRYMVDLARDKLGFFTEQFTRTFEYTWLVSQIEKDVQGKLILDIGAGVCPLPLYLSALGAKVVTIDKHPLIRKLNEQQTWNEWGFLDYSLLDPKIVSFNLSATSYKTESKFDIIYSISVIEHLPSEERKRLLHNVRKLIKDGGEFFMSIDLHPETCQVWNYSEGKLVEDYAKHGNLNSFLEHIEESGFSVLYHDVLRNIPNSRTDLAFIAAKAGFQAIKRKSIVCQLLAKINNFINLNVGRKT